MSVSERRHEYTWGHRALLGMLAGLLLVAVGMGSERSLAHVGGPRRLVDTHSYGGDLLLVFLTVGLVALGVLLWMGHARRRRDDEQWVFARSLPWWAIAVMLAFCLATVVGLGLLGMQATQDHPGRSASQPVAPQLPLQPGTTSPSPSTPHAPPPAIHWWALVAAALVLLCAMLGGWLLTRGRRPSLEVETSEAAAVSEAIVVSLDELEREPDARRAVIRAYARMEEALAHHELGRRPAETPLEHLRRALTRLRVSAGAAQHLASLFERAKFSPHDVDSVMKRDAIVALAKVREELEAAL